MKSEAIPVKVKRVKAVGEHYVDNVLFSEEVAKYAKSAKATTLKGLEPPKVSEYLGICFIRIAEGLSKKPNFVRYSYRDEMICDGIENMLKAIGNYNHDIPTRTGKPNAFSYFTQICYFAFLRRIQKEAKQYDIKRRFIEFAGIEDFMTNSENREDISGQEAGFVDVIKRRSFSSSDRPSPEEIVKITPKKAKLASSNLESYMAISE